MYGFKCEDCGKSFKDFYSISFHICPAKNKEPQPSFNSQQTSHDFVENDIKMEEKSLPNPGNNFEEQIKFDFFSNPVIKKALEIKGDFKMSDNQFQKIINLLSFFQESMFLSMEEVLKKLKVSPSNTFDELKSIMLNFSLIGSAYKQGINIFGQSYDELIEEVLVRSEKDSNKVGKIYMVKFSYIMNSFFSDSSTYSKLYSSFNNRNKENVLNIIDGKLMEKIDKSQKHLALLLSGLFFDDKEIFTKKCVVEWMINNFHSYYRYNNIQLFSIFDYELIKTIGINPIVEKIIYPIDSKVYEVEIEKKVFQIKSIFHTVSCDNKMHNILKNLKQNYKFNQYDLDRELSEFYINNIKGIEPNDNPYKGENVFLQINNFDYRFGFLLNMHHDLYYGVVSKIVVKSLRLFLVFNSLEDFNKYFIITKKNHKIKLNEEKIEIGHVFNINSKKEYKISDKDLKSSSVDFVFHFFFVIVSNFLLPREFWNHCLIKLFQEIYKLVQNLEIPFEFERKKLTEHYTKKIQKLFESQKKFPKDELCEKQNCKKVECKCKVLDESIKTEHFKQISEIQTNYYSIINNKGFAEESFLRYGVSKLKTESKNINKTVLKKSLQRVKNGFNWDIKSIKYGKKLNDEYYSYVKLNERFVLPNYLVFSQSGVFKVLRISKNFIEGYRVKLKKPMLVTGYRRYEIVSNSKIDIDFNRIFACSMTDIIKTHLQIEFCNVITKTHNLFFDIPDNLYYKDKYKKVSEKFLECIE